MNNSVAKRHLAIKIYLFEKSANVWFTETLKRYLLTKEKSCDILGTVNAAKKRVRTATIYRECPVAERTDLRCTEDGFGAAHRAHMG